MDEVGGYYVKWNKPRQKDKYHMNLFVHVVWKSGYQGLGQGELGRC